MSDAPPQRTRVRRGAVSASVMTEEQATSYVKKVHDGVDCTLSVMYICGLLSWLVKIFQFVSD